MPLLDLLTDEHLPEMREKAALLAQIPGDKRALFIARELKGLVAIRVSAT